MGGEGHTGQDSGGPELCNIHQYEWMLLFLQTLGIHTPSALLGDSLLEYAF